MSILAALERSPSFSHLSPDQLSTIEAAFVLAPHADAHVIARQGERGGEIFLVVAGQVEVSRIHGQERRLLNVMEVGDLFGLVSLVDDEPRSATCTAKGPVEVASLPRAAATLLFRARAPIALAFQQALGRQLARDFRRLDAQLRALYVAAPA